MDTPAKTALGGGLISALAIGGMVAAAVTVGATAGTIVDPAAPPARAATDLTTFQDCAALQKWYVDHAIDRVGPFGWQGIPIRFGVMRETEDAAASPTSAGASTGTNTQEAEVDEPDVVKTDGRLVVQLRWGRRLVVTDASGPTPRQTADWRLPGGGLADSLLLVGHHVLLTTSSGPLVAASYRRTSSISPSLQDSELLDVDISDPAHPVLDSRTGWSGHQLSLRQYGDTVRMVTSTGLPELPFVHPRAGRLTKAEARRRNREIVRSSGVEDWLPLLRSTKGSAALVECNDVYHPATWSGSDTVAVATFRPGAVDAATAVAVTGAGSEVYSSTDRLYVTSTDWESTGWRGRRTTRTTTHLHAFSLAGSTTRYVASGTIDGTIRDRWSLDEYDDHLRVAFSRPDRLGRARDNGVAVLEERGGRLETVGELRGLGVDEDIQSVRWFDDLAVLVTFRQTDPLYTVDLSDPSRPRELGALKLPGFSSYLHPIGKNRLLGLGTDAGTDGQESGAQVGVFDLSDPARTRLVDKVTFGADSWLAATYDPHAFTWLPASAAAITTLGQVDRSQMVLLQVSPAGTLTTRRLPWPGGGQPRALPLADGRVALVGSRVVVVDLDD